MGLALLVTEMNRELFVGGKFAERDGEVVAQIGTLRRSGRALFRDLVVERRVIALPAAGVAPVVVRDAEEPGGKFRIAPKRREAAVGLHERFLGQIVGGGVVAASEVANEIAHGGLVAEHQLAERGAIIGGKDAGD